MIVPRKFRKFHQVVEKCCFNESADRNQTDGLTDGGHPMIPIAYHNPFKPSVLYEDIDKQWRPRPDAT